MTLEVINLQYSYGSKQVLKKVNLVADSKLTAIIGPNAAGKSTLVKCIAGILKAHGKILLDGRDISFHGDWAAKNQIGYLPQEVANQNTLTVTEFVLLGRLDTLTWRVSDVDLNSTYNVLEDLGITDIATCPLNEISGGQQQMACIAQALVRNPHLLLMDEPTNSLDLQRQMEMFELLKSLTVRNRMITLAVLHDINFAARYADEMVILKAGSIYSSGAPSKVITEEMIRDVYGVNAVVKKGPQGHPEVSPIGSIRCLPWFKRNVDF